jgi:hypothetical protein
MENKTGVERPILFSGAMVEAILEGRKTQTRRVIKLRDGSAPEEDGYDIPRGEDNQPLDYVMDFSKTYPYWQQLDCPYGKPGDLLWVRETWNAQTQSGKWWHEVPRQDRPLLNWAWTNPVEPAFEAVPPKWLPSIHMPRAASRITLEVVKIRVEQIQKITCADAGAEGVNGDSDAEVYCGFQDLWDSINSKRSDEAGNTFGWNDNPWVWVVEFKKVTR